MSFFGRIAYVGAIVVMFAFAVSAMAQGDAESTVGYRISVPLPITGTADETVIRQLQGVLDSPSSSKVRPVVVLDFSRSEDKFAKQDDPNAKPLESGRGSTFERCLALSRFLSSPEMSRVRTVAYLPEALCGHAVLPALACDKIVVGPSAQLGRATIDDQNVDGAVRGAYLDLADRRRSLPKAAIAAMVDSSETLYELETVAGNTRFVTSTELEEIRKQGQVSKENRVGTPGQLGNFTAEQLRTYRWVDQIANRKEDLPKLLGIKGALQDAARPIGPIKPIIIAVENNISLRQVSLVIRSVRAELENDRNLVIFEIDSNGGSTAASLQLANFIADIEPMQAQTIAWVKGHARGDASWIALACRQRYFSADSALGGPGEATINAATLKEVDRPLQELSKKIGVDRSVLEALAGGPEPIFEYSHALDGRIEVVSESSIAARADNGQWRQGEKVDVVDGARSAQLEKLGLSSGQVSDEAGLGLKLGWTDPIPRCRSPWLEATIERLAGSAELKFFLLMIAVATLSMELGTPGATVPGFISAVCFGLYFWLQLCNGTLAWLEILLFFGGIIFLAIELFVLPGFGIFGFGGIAMVFASVILASQTFVLPSNLFQLERLSWNVFAMTLVFLLTIIGFVVFRRQIQASPVFRYLALNPAGTDDLESLDRREVIVNFEHLNGQTGIATTRLSPAGRARIGGESVQVISDGVMLEEGTKLKVIRVRGNTIIVEELV